MSSIVNQHGKSFLYQFSWFLLSITSALLLVKKKSYGGRGWGGGGGRRRKIRREKDNFGILEIKVVQEAIAVSSFLGPIMCRKNSLVWLWWIHCLCLYRTQKCRVPCDSISKLQTQASLFRTRTTLSPPTLTHTAPSPAQNTVPFPNPCAPWLHNLRTTPPPPLDLHRFRTGTLPTATSPFSTSLPARYYSSLNNN